MAENSGERFKVVVSEHALEGFVRNVKFILLQLDGNSTKAWVGIFASVLVQVVCWWLVWNPLREITLAHAIHDIVEGRSDGDRIERQPVMGLAKTKDFVRHLELHIRRQSSQIGVGQDSYHQLSIREDCQVSNVAKDATTYLVHKKSEC